MHMSSSFRLAAAAAALLVLAGCASSGRRAPVEDRAKPAPVTSSGASSPAKVLPGAENAGKPGYYTVKPGDTLIRIALDAGQNWRDIAAWNGLDNPNRIEVEQVPVDCVEQVPVGWWVSPSRRGAGARTAAVNAMAPVDVAKNAQVDIVARAPVGARPAGHHQMAMAGSPLDNGVRPTIR